ncbi:hypothetical protein SAMN04515648_0101 [Phyllobacterium sp. CL33Tsu]|nr:hypothetical protein SAMN04515648_0101 [Phyllobacterium sp. CL33Tsu]
MVKRRTVVAKVSAVAGLMPFLLSALNIVFILILSYFIDFTPVLNSWYANVWPLNYRYIEALRGYSFTDNNIAYAVLVLSNTAAIAYLYSIIILVAYMISILSNMVSLKYYRDILDVRQAWSLMLFAMMCAAFFLVSNFEDTLSLYRLSIHRPLTISIIIMAVGILCLVSSVAVIAVVLANQLLTTITHAWGKLRK